MVRIYRFFATSWTQTAGIPPLECSVCFDEMPVCVCMHMCVGVCRYAGTCARA